METKEAVIIGGGPAGLTAAIHLARSGIQVLLLEKEPYPKHKVCGEYVSKEVLPYLEYLDIDLEQLKPKHIDRFQFTSTEGTSLEAVLPLGGLGVSRYALDNFLYQEAVKNGVVVKQQTVDSTLYENDQFIVRTREGQTYQSRQALGAFGKRSNIDLAMARPFSKKKSPWMAVKEHYEHPDFPDSLVALHNFPGGYCGVSKTETNALNLCYLTRVERFKAAGNSRTFSTRFLSQNPNLARILSNARPLFRRPLSIAQVSFHPKSLIENHMLMLGDAAGLLHPLCGNGMAMGIHSAKIASELTVKLLGNSLSRQEVMNQYKKQWNEQFRNRIRIGRLLQQVFVNQQVNSITLPVIKRFPGLLPKIISSTHGSHFV